jgi:hypothetical protein
VRKTPLLLQSTALRATPYPYIVIVLFTQQKKGSKKICTEMIEAGALVAHREKCIRQHVLIVEKNVKFPLNRMVPNQFIVGIAIRSTDQRDFNNLFLFLFSH